MNINLQTSARRLRLRIIIMIIAWKYILFNLQVSRIPLFILAPIMLAGIEYAYRWYSTKKEQEDPYTESDYKSESESDSDSDDDGNSVPTVG